MTPVCPTLQGLLDLQESKVGEIDELHAKITEIYEATRPFCMGSLKERLILQMRLRNALLETANKVGELVILLQMEDTEDFHAKIIAEESK